MKRREKKMKRKVLQHHPFLSASTPVQFPIKKVLT